MAQSVRSSRSIPAIRLTIEAPVEPRLAWAFLTEPDRVSQWFAEASPVEAVGETYRLDFGEGSVVEGLITELVPGRSFAHDWAWTDAEPLQATRVRWSVEPADEARTRITLVHDGWDEAGADDTIRDDHEAYWSGYLDDLLDLLEEAAATSRA